MTRTIASIVALAIASLAGASSAIAAEAGMTQNASPQFWWPELVDLSPLRSQQVASNPYGPNFDYAAEFSKLDLKAVKAAMRGDVLLDLRNVYHPKDAAGVGFRYESIGRPQGA